MKRDRGKQMPKSHPPSSINLNNLPPLPQSTATASGAGSPTPSSDQAKPSSEGVTKSVKKFDDEANTVADLLVDKLPLRHTDMETNSNHKSSPNPNSSGEENRESAKSELYEICAAYKWKPPCFECWKEEGPPHLRLFSFKVMVEIGGENGEMVLECFGAPKSKKTAAAEHAAEGALWYFQNFGYFPINKLGKKGKRKPILNVK